MKVIWGTVFAILLASCSGCVAPNDSRPVTGGRADWENRCREHFNVIKANLAKIQMGMKEDDVSSIIGKPTENNITRTASGKSEQWVYDGLTLVDNIEGGYASTDYYHAINVLSIHDPRVYLYFENGILTSTQGF